MSTIAYRDGIIAADTLASTGNKTMTGVRKIGRTDRFLFGLAGRFSGVHRIYNWVKEIEKDTSPHDFYKHMESLETLGLDATVLLVEKDGTIWTMTDDGGVCKVAATYESIGSGQDFALGAMYVGASASDAIEAACNFDPYSGGEVHTVSFDSPVHSPTD